MRSSPTTAAPARPVASAYSVMTGRLPLSTRVTGCFEGPLPAGWWGLPPARARTVPSAFRT